MVFKNLNYFPNLNEIPVEVITYIKGQLQTSTANISSIHSSTVSRYKQRVYKYFNTIPWKTIKENNGGQKKLSHPAKDFAVKIALESSENHNHPADIINIVLEKLKSNDFEFPTFKQLDRLVRHARAVINQKIFNSVYKSLSITQEKMLFEVA